MISYCTNDYNKLSEMFFEKLSKENTKYTIDEAIKELDKFVKGYEYNLNKHNKWVNLKPIANPKNNVESWVNAIHKMSVETPSNSVYVIGMEKQKRQFEALENAIVRFISNMPEKDKNKILRKIKTRKNKIDF